MNNLVITMPLVEAWATKAGFWLTDYAKSSTPTMQYLMAFARIVQERVLEEAKLPETPIKGVQVTDVESLSMKVQELELKLNELKKAFDESVSTTVTKAKPKTYRPVSKHDHPEHCYVWTDLEMDFIHKQVEEAYQRGAEARNP